MNDWPTNPGQFRPFPYMDAAHAEDIRKVLVRLPSPKVLEWGSGGSTFWLMATINSGTIVSVEHDPDFYRLVEAAYDIWTNIGFTGLNHASLFCLPDKKGYIHPVENGWADVAIVDGWTACRPQCLIATDGIVERGGHIFLHDSQREEYAQGKRELIDKGAEPIGETFDDLGVGLWHAIR